MNESKQRRKGKKQKQEEDLEERYEKSTELGAEEAGKKLRMLLPVKTKDGFIETRVIEEDRKDNEDEEINGDSVYNNKENYQNGEINNSDEEIEMEFEIQDKINEKKDKVISTAELLACREEVLRSRRFKIGVLSSGLLENPELKSGNFKVLLELMEESNPEVYITVRKLATVSLLEVFKDLLPSYHITQFEQEGVRLKKETLQLQNYEAILLRSYKKYLQKLEKMASWLRQKKGDTRNISEREMQLGEIAVTCMCDLLVSHPYFNFAVNIANLLIPLMDNKRPNIRAAVASCISQIFKEDKRGELSLSIVRRINQYVKARGHSVHSEILSVLLSLRIKDVNLDKEREEEAKQKKLMTHKQRILALSKRERKKNKKLEQVEKEMLETKAEENKQNKEKVLTEITSIVFTIYFRVLKQAPNSKILSVTLEGLAKFAHCINLEFYQDLVNVLNRLMEEGNLGLREQLHCIQTVFIILSGQGSALNIDPYKFYYHLYKNLLNVNAGKNHANAEIIVQTLVQVLITRRKKVSQSRLIAFIKRIATLSLQLQHNGSLGILGVIKVVMQLGKAADILLDTDSTSGDGFYQPELEEPDYCNAHCTALWELAALQRHYHSVVQKLAKNIANGVPTSGEGSLTADIAKLSPEELFKEYDPAGVVFKPAVPVPKKAPAKKSSGRHYFAKNEFEVYLNSIYSKPLFNNEFVDFYTEIKAK
ncbi:nucleolar complex protein 3 homolog isoform X2 [Cephus cinctus]|uniref:Nucleolar complex protein 3 homolog n=1 Tax=Cephus cinctus TaxID=211228 RepID=A0AAJ7FGA4_CEPCN|nr:nucleolar complex protein 3 homolog isoform X2 [Cephus cinctus]